ncbi:MAG: DUF1996 domain-containing protein [Pseudomonadales bacterium]|nr:DUF1996 domain-containing protein [Pseudomonadales bacterium]
MQHTFKPEQTSHSVTAVLLLSVLLSFLAACDTTSNNSSQVEPGSALKPGLVLSNEEFGLRDDGSGAFRTHCLESHKSFDDPLLYPNQPGASHYHVFFGNPSVDAFTTIDNLQQIESSSCDGIRLNRSAYWVPALYDAYGERIPYIEPLFYYKTGYHLAAETIQAPPANLRMIAGQAMPDSLQSTQVVKFRCASWTSEQVWFDAGDPLDHVAYIPDCPLDDIVEMRIVFPQCWDGENLDSADHQAHMAYPSEATAPQTGTGECPDSHPIAIPEISYNFSIYVTEDTGASSDWRLSSDMNPALPGGHSAHADWINGWDQEIMQAIVDNCLQTAFECGVGLLADGTRLKSVISD